MLSCMGGRRQGAMQLRAVAFAYLLLLCCTEASAACAAVKGTSTLFGDGSCGYQFDDLDRDAKQRMEQVQVWYDAGCVKGLRAVYTGGDAASEDSMYGDAKGPPQSLKMEVDEVITGVDIKAGKCIEGLKFITSKQQSLTAGSGGSPVQHPQDNAYVFGFKGKEAEDCGVSQLGFVWAVDDCTAATSITSPSPSPPEGNITTSKTPAPTPASWSFTEGSQTNTTFMQAPGEASGGTPVPSPAPPPSPESSSPSPAVSPSPGLLTPSPAPAPSPEAPTASPAPSPSPGPPTPSPASPPALAPAQFAQAPEREPVPVPTPVAVPIPMPIAFPVETPKLVPTPVEITVPVPVITVKQVPTPVEVPTPVPVPTPKPIPTPVDVPTPVPVYTPKPVPTPVEVPAPIPPASDPDATGHAQGNNHQGQPDLPTICAAGEDLVVFTSTPTSPIWCQAAPSNAIDSTGTVMVSDYAKLSSKGFGWVQAGMVCYDLGCDQGMASAGGAWAGAGSGRSVGPTPDPVPINVNMGASSSSSSGSSGGTRSSSNANHMFASKKPTLRNSGAATRSAVAPNSGRRLYGDYSMSGVSAGLRPAAPDESLGFMTAPTFVPVPIQAAPLVPRTPMASQLQSLQCRFAVCKPHNAQQPRSGA